MIFTNIIRLDMIKLKNDQKIRYLIFKNINLRYFSDGFFFLENVKNLHKSQKAYHLTPVKILRQWSVSKLKFKDSKFQ